MLNWLKSLFGGDTKGETGANDASQAPQGEINTPGEDTTTVAEEETAEEEVSPEASAVPAEEEASEETSEEAQEEEIK